MKKIWFINLIFNWMNKISNLKNEEFIKSKMKRYENIVSIFNYSIETIRITFKKD